MSRSEDQRRLAQIQQDIANKILDRQNANREEQQYINFELNILYNEKYRILKRLSK